MAKEKQPLTIVFTLAARADWVSIWEWNAVEFGVRRADSYVSFLEAEIMRLARNPGLGIEVAEYPGLFRRLVKRRARGHGHIVLYRVTERRLELMHLYHTAQDWQSKLME